MYEVLGVDIPVSSSVYMHILYQCFVYVCLCFWTLINWFVNANFRKELFCVCIFQYLHGTLNFIFLDILGNKIGKYFWHFSHRHFNDYYHSLPFYLFGTYSLILPLFPLQLSLYGLFSYELLPSRFP